MDLHETYTINDKLNKMNNFGVLYRKGQKLLIKNFVFSNRYYSPTKFKVIIETGNEFFERIIELKINDELNNYIPHELNLYVDFAKSKLIIIPIEINNLYQPKEEKIICGFNSYIKELNA